MITPRPYQQEVIDKLKNSYRAKHKHPLIVMPTGAGKACVLGFVAENATAKKNSTLIIAHRQELIFQLSLTLCNFGLEHQIIASSKTVSAIKMAQYKSFGRVFWKHDALLAVGSVQTVVRRLDKLTIHPKLIIIDEQHHLIEGNQWGQIFDQFPNALGLGLTATPQRTDGKGLGRGFGGYNDDLIEGPQMSWLIEQGFLSPYKIYTTSKQWDVSTVKKKRNGEFDEKALQEVADKPSIVGDAISHYRKVANGLKGVCYCVSIEHSKHVTAMFNANGIPAGHIDGSMFDDERRQVFADYADDKILIICNQAIISEGTDLESLTQKKGITLDVCIDLAPTTSLIIAMQRWGRVLRMKPGKTAILLDHSGNILRHGLPDMEREWSLEGEVKSSRNSEEKAISVRTCPKCFRIHLPEPTCPECHFIYPLQQRVVEEKEGDLVELTEEDKAKMKYELKWSKKREQSRADSLEELIELGKERNYKNPRGWALRIHAAREQKKLA